MTKREMIDNIIRLYGFEDKRTILFCQLAEKMSTFRLYDLNIILVLNR